MLSNGQVFLCLACDGQALVFEDGTQLTRLAYVPRRTMMEKFKDAAVRAARTFVQTFLGVYLAGMVGGAALADLANMALIEQAAAAGVVALLSFVQNAIEESAAVTYKRG